MLDVKRITFLYFMVLYILIRLTSIHFLFYIIAALIYIGILVYGSFYIGSNFYLKPICSEKTEKKIIAITFDDGPDIEFTPQILEILDKFDIKAAFFCIGERISSHPELFKKLVGKGHIVGNHSYSHSKWFDFYTAKKMIGELERTEQLIMDITGKKVKFFRPPYGVTNPALARAVKMMDYTPVGWNIRSLDTMKKNREQQVVDRIIKRLKPGSIILLHDLNPDIERILEKLLDHLAKTGYEVVRLDHLINKEAYA